MDRRFKPDPGADRKLCGRGGRFDFADVRLGEGTGDDSARLVTRYNAPHADRAPDLVKLVETREAPKCDSIADVGRYARVGDEFGFVRVSIKYDLPVFGQV